MPFEIAENNNNVSKKNFDTGSHISQKDSASGALMFFHDDNRHLFDGISQLKSESEVSVPATT